MRDKTKDAVLIQLSSQRPSDIWRGMEQARQWLKEDPEDKDVYGLLLDAAQQNREIREHIRNIILEMMKLGSKTAEQAILALPSSEQDLLEDAVDSYYAAEYSQAVELFEKVLVINPTNQSAIEYIKKARDNKSLAEQVKRVPVAASQWYRRARSYIAARDIASATASLEKAIDLAYEAGISFSEAEELLSNVRSAARQAKKVKVFISYSRKYDLEVAKEIYSFLIDNDCTPWMDIYDLIPGQDWETVIIDNIKSCDFFVACLSRHSVSTRGYILKELKEAISILEQTPEREIYLIPIRIDDCAVPHSIISRQWLDWSAPNAKAGLLKAVKSKE